MGYGDLQRCPHPDETGKSALGSVSRPGLTQPPIGYEQIIERHGYTNPQKASNALMTAKRTFNRILSANVEAQTSLGPNSSDTDVADEAQLLRILLEDPDMVSAAVNSIKDRPAANFSLTNLSTIGSSMVFIDPSANAIWSKEETSKLFEHLLDQSLAAIGLTSVLDGRSKQDASVC